MKVAVVYYTRTGNTGLLVECVASALREAGVQVSVLRIRPLKEYSPPLHLNPRLVFDTLVKGGTEIRLEPGEFEPAEYGAVVVASPIWISRLAPPAQQFLRKYAGRLGKYVLVVTSELGVNCGKVASVVERVARARPAVCFSVRGREIRSASELGKIVRVIAGAVSKLAQ